MMRKVAESNTRVASSINGPWKYYFWVLVLECGHIEERSAKYGPFGGWGSEDPPRRGFALMYHPRPFSKMLPPAKWVRCRQCRCQAGAS